MRWEDRAISTFCNRRFAPASICSECGKPLGVRHVRALSGPGSNGTQPLLNLDISRPNPVAAALGAGADLPPDPLPHPGAVRPRASNVPARGRCRTRLPGQTAAASTAGPPVKSLCTGASRAVRHNVKELVCPCASCATATSQLANYRLAAFRGTALVKGPSGRLTVARGGRFWNVDMGRSR
jgi:hypothetical protein